MGEDKEIPAEKKISSEVSTSEYSKAYNHLKVYIENPCNEHIETYDELANTFPLGSYLKTAIESKGKISKENKKNRYINSDGNGRWVNPRWSVADQKKVALSTVHEPENNCIHISCTTEDQGYKLFIPIDTHPQGLFVKQEFPYITVWEGHESTLSYNPTSDDFRESPDYLVMYSECLYESVSNLLNILPKPTTS